MNEIPNSPPPIVSLRESKPHAMSLIVSLPAGLGLEASYHLSDRVALSAQLSTLVALSDVAAQLRFFPVTSKHAGLYVAGGIYGFNSPVLLPESFPIAPGLLFSLGGEYRWDNGFIFAGELGAAPLVFPPGSEGAGNRWEPGIIPRAQLRLGYAW